MDPATASSLHDEFFGENVREEAELDALARVLPDMRRCIDVGANIGQYAVHANRFMCDGEIVAVEANPALIPLLEESLTRAGEEEANGNRFRVLNRAAHRESGQTIDLHLGASPTTSSVAPIGDSNETVQVETLCLDDLFEPEGATLIKIDVEGAEYAVVEGATRWLESKHAMIFIELHCWGDRSTGRYPHHVLAYLAKRGYAAEKVGTHFLFSPAAPGPCRAGVWRHTPLLLLKEFIYRFFPRAVPVIEGWMGRGVAG